MNIIRWKLNKKTYFSFAPFFDLKRSGFLSEFGLHKELIPLPVGPNKLIENQNKLMENHRAVLLWEGGSYWLRAHQARLLRQRSM